MALRLKLLRLGVLGAAVVLGAHAAHAQTCAPSSLVPPSAGQGARPGLPVHVEASYLVSALPGLTAAALSSPRLLAQGGTALQSLTCTRPGFSVGAANYTLAGQDGSAFARIAFSPQANAVAALIRLDLIDNAPAAANPALPPVAQFYVLATVKGSTISVWEFYDGIPDDRLLVGQMQGALAGTAGRPQLKFDPAFKAGGLAGAAQYILPPG